MDLTMQLPELISMILGALVPVAIEPLKKFFATRVKRFFAALGLSSLVGAIAFLMTKPATADVADIVVYVFGFSQLAYNGFWKQLWQAAKSDRTQD